MCVCLCVNAYIYTRMYVCMYACTYLCMFACMHVCMFVSMLVCMFVSMLVCICVYMYVCMYVCIMYAGSRPPLTVIHPKKGLKTIFVCVCVEYEHTHNWKYVCILYECVFECRCLYDAYAHTCTHKHNCTSTSAVTHLQASTTSILKNDTQ